MRPVLLLLATLLLPLSASAQVVITEVMYDLPGTDSGREWIEIRNDGASDIDLASWKLFEQDTNHQLVPQGSPIVPSGGYAVIADNVSAFLSDYSGFAGALFDSSFSLSNEEETVALKNGDSVEASVTYNGTWGAAGDGNSLQWDGGVWRAAAPTPGSAGDFSKTISPNTEMASANDTAEQTKTSDGPKKPRGPLSLDLGTDRAVTTGALQWFGASVTAGGEPYPMRVHYTWNFGDGTVRVGERVSHQYDHSGTYAVYVEASTYDGKLLTGRFKVVSDEAQAALSVAPDGSVTLSNTGNRELDVSGWAIAAPAGRFVVPEHTFILPHASVTFSRARTGLSSASVTEVALFHPDGSLAVQGGLPQAPAARALSSATRSTPSSAVSFPAASAEEDAFALAAAAGGAPKSNLSIWLMALMGLLGIALLIIIMVRYNEGTASEAAAYTIIDAESGKSVGKK